MATKDNDFNIDYSVTLANKVPILINDETWNKVFGKLNYKDLINLKEELKELIFEQKKIDAEIKKVIKEKRKAMTDIVNLSHRVNSGVNKYVEDLNQRKEFIYELNDKLDELTFRFETLPSLIKQSNFELLKVTVRYAYGVIKENGEKEEKVSLEIEELRERLRELIDKKNNYEEIKSKTYGFLHGILGHKEMEKLDNKLL